MKKLILLSCACLLSIFSFAETEYSLKQYFEENILKLDPIEGIYDIEFLMRYLTPYVDQNSKGYYKWYVKKEGNIYTLFSLSTDLSIERTSVFFQKIGDTNAYYYNNDGIGNKERFILNNNRQFLFTCHLNHEAAKKVTQNPGLASCVNIYYTFNGIKSYPTSAMYLEAARKDAEQAEKELQEAIEQAQRKAGWSGSGFALAQGHIVTNYHVVENAKTILVKGIKGDFVTEYRASVVAIDKVNDIAIIKISDDRFKGFGAAPYKIKRSMSDVGESVWALGYPMVGVMGDEVKFTDGKISARTGIQGDMSVYQISVPIQPGNSGGPLFDNYGNIVGITSSGLNREAFNSENVNYAIKTSYLYNLIESSMSTSILPQGTAMQGQSLTEKIKLAKKFVYVILCSEDPNFHNIEPQSLHATSEETKPNSISNGNPPKAVEQANASKRDTLPNGDIVILNPSYETRCDLDIIQIRITKFNTILHCIWHNTKYYPLGWCNINSTAAHLLTNKGEKLYFVKAENIPYEPDREEVDYDKIIFFSLYFEKLPSNVENFDFYESKDSEWKIYNIKVQ